MNSFNKNEQNGAETTLKYFKPISSTHLGKSEKEPKNPDKETILTKELSPKSLKYPIPIKKAMEKTIEEKIEEDVLKVFENSTRDNYIKTLDELSKLTGYTKESIDDATNSLDFAGGENITTRKLYKRYTPFFTQFMHGFRCRIEL